MHSNELARRAGVTVRTLRHYHQIGLLPEPPRSASGYREYTVGDLATVLRIAKFTDLGVPLDRVRLALNDLAATQQLLDELARNNADELERIERRQRIIQDLRTSGLTPDVPLHLAPFAAMLRRSPNSSSNEEAFEREQLALLAHISAGPQLEWLTTTLQRLLHSAAEYNELVELFATLTDAVPDTTIENLAARLARLLHAVVPWAELPILETDSVRLLLAHQDERLNSTQKRAWARTLQQLDGPPDPEPEQSG